MDFPNSLLAIFAHPDDETYAVGGFLALAAKNGVRVTAVSATRGDKGKLHLEKEMTGEEIAAMRAEEMKDAAEVLGVEKAIALEYPDGSLGKQDEGRVVGDLCAVIDDVKPQAIVTFAPDGSNGHRDHIAIHRFAMSAFERARLSFDGLERAYWRMLPRDFQKEFLEFVGGSRSLTEDHYDDLPRWNVDEQHILEVDVSSVIKIKNKAARKHRSQNPEWFVSLPDNIRKNFWETEHYYIFE